MSDVRPHFWESRSEPVALAAMAALAVLLFALTSFAARAFHTNRQELAQQWFERGIANLERGRPAQAVEDFRNALVYRRDDPQFSLRLAQSLASIGRRNEAQSYLLNLWERSPGDGVINLELARLAAQGGRVEEAHRYYHNAVYGVWERQADRQRRRVRLEMVEFLLTHQQNTAAIAELAGLAEDLPEGDAAARVQLAQLYARSGDHEHALAQFRAALDLDRNHSAALEGAGQSAFALERYRLAETYLARALRENPKHASLRSRLEIARAIQELDPFVYRLSAANRAQRAARAYQLTMERLRNCAASKQQPLDAPDLTTPLQQQYKAGTELKLRATAARLRRDEPALDAVMDFVFRAQPLGRQECGPGTPADEALVLLATGQARE